MTAGRPRRRTGISTRIKSSPFNRGDGFLLASPKLVSADALKKLPGLEGLDDKRLITLPGLPRPAVSTGSGRALYFDRRELVAWWRARNLMVAPNPVNRRWRA